MTESALPEDEHASCKGHVKLGVITTASMHMVVIHARITLPRDIAWVPYEAFYDSKGTLTARWVSDGFFLTSAPDDGQREMHVILTQALHQFETSYNQEIRGLIIHPADEATLMMEMTKACLRDDAPNDSPPSSPTICFNRDVESLLAFIEPLVTREPQDDTDPNRALRRDYFLLGEARPYVEW